MPTVFQKATKKPLQTLKKFLDNQSWHDLITGTVTSPDTQMLMMAPYQTVWISNTGIQ